MKYILHSYRRCPYCVRVRIVMHLKGIEYDVIEEPMRKWTKWLQVWAQENNERSRVPIVRYIALSDDSKEQKVVLPESNDINLFLDQHNGDPKFTPERGSEAYAEMETWWGWFSDEMKPALDVYKYGENREWSAQMNVVHMQKLAAVLQKIETYLEAHEFLVEERLTLADIAIIPFIHQIKRVRDGEFDFTQFPRITKWANTILETDWFKDEVMRRYPLAEVGV